MEQMLKIKNCLISIVASQMENLREVNTKELGEAIDMIKDMSEAIYYCSITKAMDNAEEERENMRNTNNYYYTERYMPYDTYHRDMDRMEGRMYYGEDNNSTSSSTNMNNSTKAYSERDYPMMRDGREGRSPMRRKMYMESKATHQDEKAMNDLENYMRDLNQDIMEMINQASPEEKALLQKKINVLATKLQNV